MTRFLHCPLFCIAFYILCTLKSIFSHPCRAWSRRWMWLSGRLWQSQRCWSRSDGRDLWETHCISSEWQRAASSRPLGRLKAAGLRCIFVPPDKFQPHVPSFACGSCECRRTQTQSICSTNLQSWCPRVLTFLKVTTCKWAAANFSRNIYDGGHQSNFQSQTTDLCLTVLQDGP